MRDAVEEACRHENVRLSGGMIDANSAVAQLMNTVMMDATVPSAGQHPDSRHAGHSGGAKRQQKTPQKRKRGA